ncbi:MAG: alkaline phosphatase PhoX [Sphingomonas sp.]
MKGAWYGKATVGKKLSVYLGDDSRGEYLYKYVSTQAWVAADAQNVDRLAMGDKYLDSGTLYVAKFNSDGTGAWLPLVFGSVPDRPAQGSDIAYAFADQNDILVNTRLAADAVGATKMDRPEWTATNNVTGEVYLTLTNNTAAIRPLNGTDAANPRHYNDPRGTPPTAQFGNPNGHIIRLREDADDPAAVTFKWDIYLFGADLRPGRRGQRQPFGPHRGQRLLEPRRAVVLAAAERRGPRQAAAVDPDRRRRLHRRHQQPDARGDARYRRRRRRADDHQRRIGRRHRHPGDPRRRPPATAATLKRFLVGPVECELTGVDTTPDGRTLFVGIQHPGELGTPHRAHQPLAGQPGDRHRRRHRPPAFGDRGDHQERRRHRRALNHPRRTEGRLRPPLFFARRG